MRRRSLLLSLCFLSLSEIGRGGEGEIDFGRDIRPILSDKCFFCHGPDEENRKAKLRLDLKTDAFAVKDGIAAFVAGAPLKSEAWHRISSDEEDEVMPPPEAKKPLSAREKELIRKWVESGANWTEHWSFIAPQKTAPPLVNGNLSDEVVNPIDAFILAEVEAHQLKPAELTDRRTLIRRITFDLSGLPPTPGEVDAFVTDESPDAYAKVVDRLLASKHFGERMALMWLDAARYGDTSVMHADGPREMWPWRDWVVHAFNENQPYDQFSIEQIAGDLLPNASNSQIVASGFNRNHPSSDEGGAIAEELRVGYVADRVKTTSNVWLGLSMECAQCHDHKYDPISHKEYFQFYAYFNNTADPGMQTRKGNQAPVAEVVTELEEDKLAELETKLSTQSGEVAKIRKEALATNAAAGKIEPSADLENSLKHLKHYYSFAHAGGRLLIDYIGGGDAQGARAVLKSAEGKFDTALKLDGDRAFDALSFSEVDYRSNFTLSAWIKLESKGSSGAVLAKMDDANRNRGFDLWIQGGKPGMHLINTWPSNAVKVVSQKALTPGQWQHVAITYRGKGTADSVSIFIDGKPVETTDEGKKLTKTIKTEVPFRIGGRSSGSQAKVEVDEIQFYERALLPNEIKWTMRDLTTEATNTLLAKRTPAQRKILEGQVLGKNRDYLTARTSELETEVKKQKLLSGKTTTMVMRDNPPAERRETYLLDRGMYDAPKKDEVIQPGIPAALPPLPTEAPANRLGLANWLFSKGNPLTARVATNQLWQLFFSYGIVRTPADFGAQGEFPSHPELLDWLAVDFRESGWDLKRMVRQIVLSRTYQQSSNLRPDDRDRDPDNRFLSRAPRYRLPAEMIRDNALALSGQLVKDAGGPGVKPYQPPGLWTEVGLSGKPKFVQDKGERLYRRSLYTYFKRSSPPPAMIIFDAPNRETCVMQRPVTNTPLQALAAMNDVQMMEASRHLAARVLKEGGTSPMTRAGWAFELATAREPESGELATLLNVYEHSLARFSAGREKSHQLLSAGESPRDETLPADEHAAWTIVASMILNLDEVLTRN
ncbi:MAG: DUF1553 domain-containing protein [Verrucomicrobiales bacterium]|nr:DUF1553 domain-containing protein [Verrucomicrobiales bacterium]